MGLLQHAPLIEIFAALGTGLKIKPNAMTKPVVQAIKESQRKLNTSPVDINKFAKAVINATTVVFAHMRYAPRREQIVMRELNKPSQAKMERLMMAIQSTAVPRQGAHPRPSSYLCQP